MATRTRRTRSTDEARGADAADREPDEGSNDGDRRVDVGTTLGPANRARETSRQGDRDAGDRPAVAPDRDGDRMRAPAILLATGEGTSEMDELLYSLGRRVLGRVVQKRLRADPRTFLGTGKLDEARTLMRGFLVDLEKDARRAAAPLVIVVNGELKPSQIFNLQRFFNEGRGPRDAPVEIYDRVRVILEIFADRARSEEARLQVEYAKLRYELPIVKEFIHLARSGERPGFLGGGEYDVDQYYDTIHRRMTRIRRELDRVSKERAQRRKHRRRGGFILVSLAGHTNAGKSSLLNALTGADALVENRYFSTLSTKTRRVPEKRRDEGGPRGGASQDRANREGTDAPRDRQGRDEQRDAREVAALPAPAMLLTDTVGFIEDLPPWLIDAFKSTLEEITLADVVLLVVDATETPTVVRRKVESSLAYLRTTIESRPAGTEPPALLLVLNKCDLATKEGVDAEVDALLATGMIGSDAVFRVSAKTGEGISRLLEGVASFTSGRHGYARPAKR